MKFALVFLLLATTAHAQWTRMSVPTTAGLRGLSVTSDQVIWASGTGGTVVRTIDGGKTWSLMSVSGAANLDFRGIHAFDANTAVIISSGPAERSQARIFRTVDGGKSWSEVYEQKTPGIFFDAISFWDSKHGIVLSDPVAGHFALFATADGGSSWKEIPSSMLPPARPGEGAFAASNSCLTVHGKSDVWFASGGAGVARVFRSTDRGRTWSVSKTPMHPANTSSGIFSLAFADAENGVAVGGDYQHPDGSDLPNVLITSDGGRSWHSGPATDPAGVYFSSVALDDGRIIAAGIRGLWSSAITFGPNGTKTRSGAAHWKQESTENVNTVAVGHHKVWAVGAGALVLTRVK
ncbi:MAG TPA: hypothetical protein VJN64_02700 [Terriglobales bacterium]|nr:hypothetical protein [Terriglobales bacterium]